MTMFTTTTTANPTRRVLLVAPAAADADKPQDHCHIEEPNEDDQQNNHNHHDDRSTSSTSTMIMDTTKADNMITSLTRTPTPTASTTTPPPYQNQNGHYSHNHTTSEEATNKVKQEQQDEGIQSAAEKKDSEPKKHFRMENDLDTKSRMTRMIPSTTEEQQRMEDPQTKKNMSSAECADEMQLLRDENVSLQNQVDELTYNLQMCRSEKIVLKQKCTSLELQLAHHCKVGHNSSNDVDTAVVVVAADEDRNAASSLNTTTNSKPSSNNANEEEEEENATEDVSGGTETKVDAVAEDCNADEATGGTVTGDNGAPADSTTMTSMLLQMLQDMEQERNMWKSRALDMKQKYTKLLKKEEKEEVQSKKEAKKEVTPVSDTKTTPQPVLVMKAANANMESQTSPTATAPRKVVIRRSTMSHTTTMTQTTQTSSSTMSSNETILTHKFGQPSPAATAVAPSSSSSNNNNTVIKVAQPNNMKDQEELPAEVWKERAYQMKAKVKDLKEEQLKLNEALKQYQQYLQMQHGMNNGNAVTKLPVVQIPLQRSTPQQLTGPGGQRRNTITHSNCTTTSSYNSDQRNTSTTSPVATAPSNTTRNGNNVKHNAAATTAPQQQGLIRRGTLTMYYAKQPQSQRSTKRGSTTGGMGTTANNHIDDRFVIRKSSVSSVTSTSSNNSSSKTNKLPPTHRFGEYSWRSTPAELNEEEAKSLRRASLTSSQGSIDLEELNSVMNYERPQQQNATWNIVRPPSTAAMTSPFMSSQEDLPSTRRFGENPHPSTTATTTTTTPASSSTSTTTTTRRFGENPHPSAPAAAATTTPLLASNKTRMTRPTATPVFESSIQTSLQQQDLPSTTRRFGENPHPSSKKSPVSATTPTNSCLNEQQQRRRMSLDPSMLQNMSPRTIYNGNELTAEGKPVTRKFGQNSSGHRRYSMSEGGSGSLMQASTAMTAEANTATAGTKEEEDLKKANEEDKDAAATFKKKMTAPKQEVQAVPTVPLKTTPTVNALTSCELLAAAQPPRIALPSVSTSLEGLRRVPSNAVSPKKTVARSADPLFDTTTSSSSSASFQKSKMKRATPLVARAAEPDTSNVMKKHIKPSSSPFKKVHQTSPPLSKKEMFSLASVQPRPIPLPSFSTNQTNLRHPQQQPLRRSSLDHAVGLKSSPSTSPKTQRRSSLSNAQQQLLLASVQPKPIPLPALSIDGCMQRRPPQQQPQQHPQRRSSLSKSSPPSTTSAAAAAALSLTSPEMLASIQPMRIPLPSISTQDTSRKPQQHPLRRASLSASSPAAASNGTTFSQQQEEQRRLSLSQSFSFGQTIESSVSGSEQHIMNSSVSKSFNYGPPATTTSTTTTTCSAKVSSSCKTGTPSSKSAKASEAAAAGLFSTSSCSATTTNTSAMTQKMILAAAQPMRIPLPSISTHESRQRRSSLTAASAAATTTQQRRASLSKSSSFGASATEESSRIPFTNHHQRRCSLDSSCSSLMKSSPDLMLASVQPRRIPLPACSTSDDNLRQPSMRRSSLSNSSSPPSVALPLSSPEMLAAAQPVRIPLPSLSTSDDRQRQLPSSSIKKSSSNTASLELLAAAQPIRIPLPPLSTSDDGQRRLPLSPSVKKNTRQQPQHPPQSPQPRIQQQQQERYHPAALTPNCTPIHSRNAVTSAALPFMFTPKPSPAMIEQSIRNLAQTTQETGAIASEALLNTLTNTLQEDSFSSHEEDIMSSSPINTGMINGDARAVSYPPYLGTTGARATAGTVATQSSIQQRSPNNTTIATRGVVNIPQTMRRASAA